MRRTRAANAFKAAVATFALAARAASRWPKNLWRIDKTMVSRQLYGTRMDADGPRKLIRDALAGVLYVNDRDTCDGLALFPMMDGRGKRVEVIVDLLSVVTPTSCASAPGRPSSRSE